MEKKMESYEVIFPGNKKVDVKLKQYTIKTDQTKENGGDETAPEPFDLFLSYAKSFCDIRKIDTTNMKIEQEVFSKEGQKLLEEIKLTLYVNKEFPEKYEKPILKAMGSCAVKNQLHPDIKTTMQTQRYL